MVRVVVPLNFNAFLEKAKLKDDSSNYTYWVRNLRIILIAAQKNYCSDPTSDGQISVHKCHPWISNADTHSTRGFITECNHTLITSKCLKERVLNTIIWLKAI
jgi:hypothetical protein